MPKIFSHHFKEAEHVRDFTCYSNQDSRKIRNNKRKQMTHSNGDNPGEFNRNDSQSVCEVILVKLAMGRGVGAVASAFVNTKHRTS